MSLLRLPGVALITGAGGTGIGAAVAKAFAASGCHRLALTDINPSSLSQTRDAVRALNPQADITSLPGDISDAKFVDHLVRSVSSTFSRIDYAVNCAGILGSGRRTGDMEIGEYDKLMAVNLRGSWLVNRGVFKVMEKQEALGEHPAQKGAVVNVASQLGIVARPGAPAYCASKSALINLTRADAIDYAKDQIRVNCVCPGVIETPMTVGSDEVKSRIGPAVAIAPAGRMGKVGEVADAVLWLCSGKSSFVVGHALVVDGGYTIN